MEQNDMLLCMQIIVEGPSIVPACAESRLRFVMISRVSRHEHGKDRKNERAVEVVQGRM